MWCIHPIVHHFRRLKKVTIIFGAVGTITSKGSMSAEASRWRNLCTSAQIRVFSCTGNVNVEKQYIPDSALWTLTVPVPRTLPLSQLRLVLHPCDVPEQVIIKLHCYHHQQPPWTHQHQGFQLFNCDLDHFKAPQPPADLMSVQHLNIYKQKSNMYVVWI
jgi:hypothetical protein